MAHNVLVVDDDINVLDITRLYLEKEGMEVLCAQDGKQGLEIFKRSKPDVVILDLMMPRMDGTTLCREIRQIDTTPIIILSAKSDTFDKVLCLEIGADDYIVKPFDAKELVARVKAVSRRARDYKEAQDDISISFKDLHIDRRTYTVRFKNATLDLPPKEFELLYFLAGHPDQVFTREQLLDQIWGFEFFGDSRTVDVHIKRLREKLNASEHWNIKTVWGVGYKFEVYD